MAIKCVDDDEEEEDERGSITSTGSLALRKESNLLYDIPSLNWVSVKHIEGK